MVLLINRLSEVTLITVFYLIASLYLVCQFILHPNLVNHLLNQFYSGNKNRKPERISKWNYNQIEKVFNEGNEQFSLAYILLKILIRVLEKAKSYSNIMLT